MLPKDGKMHFSNLKRYSQSPAHYYLSCDSDGYDPKHYKVGRAIHKWILLSEKPVWFSEGKRKGKKWAAFVLSSGVPECDILNDTEYASVLGAYKSVITNKLAMQILEGTKRETYIEWEHNGTPCAGTIDAHNDVRIAELKSCSCAKPRKFLYDAHKFSYHAQTPWYDVGLGTKIEQFGTNWREHYIIAVETSAPYSCVVYKLDNLRIDQGHILFEEWLAKHCECQESGFWPSYAEDQPVIWDGEIIIEQEEDD